MKREKLFPYIVVKQEDKERQKMTYDKISISSDEYGCYFHVLGDNKNYMDLDSLINNHPELSEYVKEHRYELQRGLYQLQELIETHEVKKKETLL